MYKVRGKRKRVMGKRLLYSLMLCFTLLLLGMFDFAVAAPTGTAKPYTELQFAPLPSVKLPKYDRFVLQNGMAVYLMEDRDLPLVNGTMLVRTGDRLEAADKVGLAEFTGEVMRTGGTRKHTPDQLNEMLEQRAASVETSIGETSGSASFDVLSEDLETVFGLFAEVLREPMFAADKLELAKTQERGGISRRNDSPDAIAGREFSKLIYGKDSPYARTTEYASLEKITRQDLSQFYQQYFRILFEAFSYFD